MATDFLRSEKGECGESAEFDGAEWCQSQLPEKLALETLLNGVRSIISAWYITEKALTWGSGGVESAATANTASGSWGVIRPTFENENENEKMKRILYFRTSHMKKISDYIYNNFIQLFLIWDNKAASLEIIMHSILLFDSSTNFLQLNAEYLRFSSRDLTPKVTNMLLAPSHWGTPINCLIILL